MINNSVRINSNYHHDITGTDCYKLHYQSKNRILLLSAFTTNLFVSDCQIGIRKDLSEKFFYLPTYNSVIIEAESCKGSEDVSYCQCSANTNAIINEY